MSEAALPLPSIPAEGDGRAITPCYIPLIVDSGFEPDISLLGGTILL